MRERRSGASPSRLVVALRRSSGIIIFLLLWQGVATFYVSGGGGAVPGPAMVFEDLIGLLSSRLFWNEAWVSVMRGFIGLGAALVVGLVLGLVFARSRFGRAALMPTFSFLYPVPRIVFFPLAVVVLGIGTVPQATLVAIEVLFPLTLATYAGLQAIGRDQYWVIRNAQAPRWSAWLIMLRMALPSILTGMRIAAPIMLTLIVATQMFAGSSDGLGYLIQRAASRIDSSEIFAIAILVGIFGLMIDLILVFLLRRTQAHEKLATI